MKYYPHADRRNFLAILIFVAIASIIIIGCFSCTKSNPLPGEPQPANMKIREWIKKHTAPKGIQDSTASIN